MNPFHIICWLLLGAAAIALIVFIALYITGLVALHRRRKQIHAWRRTIKAGTLARYRNLNDRWTNVSVRWVAVPQLGVAFEDRQCGVEWETGISTGSREIEISALYPREGEKL